MEFGIDYLPFEFMNNDILECFFEIFKKLKESSAVYVFKKEDNFMGNKKDVFVKKLICFNNGLSTVNSKFYSEKIIFLYSLYPIFNKNIKNTIYMENFKKKFLENLKEPSSKWILSSNYHKKLILSCGALESDLTVLYPFLPNDFTHSNPSLARAYIKGKFNIHEPFLICCGTCDESFNIEKILNFYKKNNLKLKLIFLLKSFSKERLNQFKEKIYSEIDSLIIEDFTVEDQINLISSSLALLDYSSQYVVNLWKIKALFLNTPIITDLNPLNLEFFEDFPYYDFEITPNELLNLRKRSFNLEVLQKKFKNNLKDFNNAKEN